MSTYLPFQADKWQGFVLDDCHELADTSLDQWLQEHTTKIIKDFPLRTIALYQRPDNKPSWYIKTLRGIGDQHQTFLASLKWRLRSSRAFHILNISRELGEAGFLCPKVLLAARKREGGFLGNPTDLVITVAAPGRLVSNWLTGDDGLPRLNEAERHEMLARIGQELAKIHQAGFVHGDCHPGNYFWQPGQDGFCYIDNDRTQKYPRRNLSGAIRNMVSAGFFLLNSKHNRIQREEWQDILEAYVTQADFTPAQHLAFYHGIEKALSKRLRRGK